MKSMYEKKEHKNKNYESLEVIQEGIKLINQENLELKQKNAEMFKEMKTTKKLLTRGTPKPRQPVYIQKVKRTNFILIEQQIRDVSRK